MNEGDVSRLMSDREVIKKSSEAIDTANHAGIIPVLPDYGVFLALGCNLEAYREFLLLRADHSDIDLVVGKMSIFHQKLSKLKP